MTNRIQSLRSVAVLVHTNSRHHPRPILSSTTTGLKSKSLHHHQHVPRHHFHASTKLLAAAKKDLYETLGLKRGASKDEIKSKYRELAKKYHPDVNSDKNASEKFKEISSAYEILEDDAKRQKYDNFGVTDDSGGGGDPFGGQNPFAGFGGFGGFGGGGFPGGGGGFRYTGNMGGGNGASGGAEDIFGMFTNAMKREQTMAGRDVRAGLTLSFLEAVNGCTKDVSFEYAVPDKDKGGRSSRRTKSVTVDIPAGVESGMTIKMMGQGAEAMVGKNVGDLYIELSIADDPYFRREKYDIFTEVHVGMVQAALGCTVDVCTLDGIVEMKVRAGTQPGTSMSLRGKGVKHLNSAGKRRGNHYVKVNVEVPTKLTDRQKQLLEELLAVEGTAAAAKPGGKDKTFVDKAWERLQSFLGSDGTKASSSSS